MEKRLQINCGTGLLLRFRPEVFDPYDRVEINVGSLVMSPEVSAELAKRAVQLNAGETQVMDVRGTLVDIGENARIDAAGDYTGCFLVSEGSVVLLPGGEVPLAHAEGLFVDGTLYHPASVSPGAMGRVTAEKMQAYPDGALVETDDITLSLGTVARLAAGAHLWMPGTIEAFDEAALAQAQQQDIRFTCRRLKTQQALDAAYGELFTTGEKQVVPDGYVLEKDLILTRLSLAAYDEGTRLYVQGDLTLHPRDAGSLQKLSSIIVEGKASLPVDSVADFRRIGTAKEIFAYEGELWQVTGRETLDHAALQAALGENLSYTLVVRGSLEFDEDVTTEDLKAIRAIYYKGALACTPALKPLLASRVVKGKGTVLDIALMRRAAGEDVDEATSTINMGVYKLL